MRRGTVVMWIGVIAVVLVGAVMMAVMLLGAKTKDVGCDVNPFCENQVSVEEKIEFTGSAVASTQLVQTVLHTDYNGKPMHRQIGRLLYCEGRSEEYDCDSYPSVSAVEGALEQKMGQYLSKQGIDAEGYYLNISRDEEYMLDAEQGEGEDLYGREDVSTFSLVLPVQDGTTGRMTVVLPLGDWEIGMRGGSSG